jgi:hypothetical protein
VDKDTSINTSLDAEEELPGTELKSSRIQLKKLSMREVLDNTMARSEDAEDTGEHQLLETKEPRLLEES